MGRLERRAYAAPPVAIVRLRTSGRPASGAGLGSTASIATAVAGAWLYVRDPARARLLAFAFAGAVIALAAPLPLLVVSLAASFAFRRVAVSGIDISYADVLLTVTAVASIRFAVAAANNAVRRALVAAAAFQVILLVAVAANPTEAAAFEWLHRIVLVAGAIIVGVALRHTGLLTLALRGYYGVAALFAADALRLALTTGFEPAYPFGMQKNPAGLLMAFALLSLFVTPRIARLAHPLAPLLGALLLLGLLATRSRGAMVALLLASVLWAVRSGRARVAFPLAIAAGAAMVLVIYVTTESELELVRANPELERFKGIGARIETNERGLELFRDSPIVGQGLRYFRDPAFRASEPHNVVVVTLSEGGVIGGLALTVLLGGALHALRGRRGPLAQLARLAVLMRFTAGLLDIYWVAGTGSLPWILVGLALTDDSRDRGAAPVAAAS